MGSVRAGRSWVAAAVVMLAPSMALAAEAVPAADALRAELLAMLGHDQEMSTRHARDGAEVEAERTQLNRRHTERMRQIVATHGWPGKAAVGVDGAMAAWVLVQHADDVAFQEQCLALMEPAAARGDVPMPHVAYLTDRVRVARGKPQLYGTQFRDVRASVRAGQEPTPHPIEDEARVDARRAAIGLPPLAEYREMLQELHRDAAR